MRKAGWIEICTSVWLLVLLAFVGCGDEERQWETARDAAGAIEGDRIEADQQWRLYRQNVILSLDEMKVVLLAARDQTAVDQRPEVDALTGRIATLRQDMISEMDESGEQAARTRVRLKDAFDGLRNETNALLSLLGHDREEFRKWQDIE